MRILLVGGTGLIGQSVAQALIDRGVEVHCYTRKPRKPRPSCVYFGGNSDAASTFQVAMEACDAVINLAGAPIACRWTPKSRALIKNSRIATTQALVLAAQNARNRPKVWLNASAVGYYGANPQGLCDEAAPLGSGFLAQVTDAWEAAAQPVEAMGTRLVTLRFGAVLARHGGMLPLFVTAAKSFVGGPLGSGKQPLSWIHITDATRMLLWCLDDAGEALRGPVNCVAPNPSQQQQLIVHLGNLLHRPVWLRTPSWALQWVMGDMAHELILGGQEVIPKVALQHGFSWRYPHLTGALDDLMQAG